MKDRDCGNWRSIPQQLYAYPGRAAHGPPGTPSTSVPSCQARRGLFAPAGRTRRGGGGVSVVMTTESGEAIDMDSWLLDWNMDDTGEALRQALELLDDDDHELRAFVLECAKLSDLYPGSDTEAGREAYVRQAALVGYMSDHITSECGIDGIRDADKADLSAEEIDLEDDWSLAVGDIQYFVCMCVSGNFGQGMFSRAPAHASSIIWALVDAIKLARKWTAEHGGGEAQ